MTGLYDWNPMPHSVNVRCPACRSLAVFEFAEIARIKLVKDIGFFQKSDAFDYQIFEDSNGSRWHGAIFYHSLRAKPSFALRDLPDGYSPETWEHSQYLYRSHGLDWGAVVCGSCGYRKKHHLSWPGDAYFQVEYKSNVLWAFDRESATALLDYICSETRETSHSKWAAFLRHIPSLFLKKGARGTVSKNLKKLLAEVGGSPL